MTPNYWKQATKELGQRDLILKKLIDEKYCLEIKLKSDPFITLTRAIIGQQISVKAAETIWLRFLEVIKTANPENVCKTPEMKLKQVGLSSRKIQYIRDLSNKFINEEFNIELWPKLENKEIVTQLVSVKGIGVWTAEMFLIFYLARPNVLPLADIGLQRAMSIQYTKGNKISQQEMISIGQTWSPWQTVATWYLWRSIDPIPVEY